MKKLLIAAALVAASQGASAGSFIYRATGNLNSDDLEGKFDSIVSDKFTKKYPSSKWWIYIYTTSVSSNTDGSTLVFASVGVTKSRLSGAQPALNVWEALGHDGSLRNTTLVQRKPYIVAAVQRALRRMMDECEKSPNCDIDN